MKVRRTKILLVAMTMSSVLMSGMPVRAYENNAKLDSGIELQYVNLEEGSAELSIAGGNANCRTYAACKKAKSISITMTLQKASGGTWTKIATWTGSKNATSYKFEKTKINISKGKYRVKAIIKCGSDSKTTYSSSKSY